MRVLSEIASVFEPGICSATKYSVAMKATVKPATLLVRLGMCIRSGFETCVEIGSKIVMTNLGNGGSMEVMLAALRLMERVN